jgi:hypothetical protein
MTTGRHADRLRQGIQHINATIANNSISSNIEKKTAMTVRSRVDYGVTDQVIDAIVRAWLREPLPGGWANGNERETDRCDVEGYGDYYSIAPPAGAKNHITVGAVYVNTDAMTSFSSWGPTDDGRMKPDVVAPGHQAGGDNGVTSTSSAWIPLTSSSGALPWRRPPSRGARPAAPRFRARFPGQPDPRNSTLKVLLAQTAVDVGNAGPGYETGYGSIRIKQAIDQMRAAGRFLRAM